MAELSRDDVVRAVKDGLSDIRNDVNRIRDGVARIDERTNDLDRSQEEIKRVVDLVPRLETLTKTDKLDRLVNEIGSLKVAQASTQQYLEQVAKYLESLDQQMRGSGAAQETWRK